MSNSAKKFKTAVQELIELSVVSATLGRLRTEDGYETRGQLNITLVSPFGSGKSSLFRAIEKAGLGERVTDYTYPSMVGSIRPSGKLVKGFVLKVAGSTMLIDEFQKFDRRSKEALLSLMEDQFYRRSLGYEISAPIEDRGEYYVLRGAGNTFELEARLSFITGAMYFNRKSIDEMALISRSFPIVLSMSKEDAIKLFLGLDRIHIDNRLLKVREEIAHREILVPRKLQEVLADRFMGLLLDFELDTGYITRALWDLTRIAAIRSAMDGYSEVQEDNIFYALGFAPMQIIGYNRGRLSKTQMKVYSYILDKREPVKAKTIVQELKEEKLISERAIYEALSTLEKLKLVEAITIGRNKYYQPRGVYE